MIPADRLLRIAVGAMILTGFGALAMIAAAAGALLTSGD